MSRGSGLVTHCPALIRREREKGRCPQGHANETGSRLPLQEAGSAGSADAEQAHGVLGPSWRPVGPAQAQVLTATWAAASPPATCGPNGAPARAPLGGGGTVPAAGARSFLGHGRQSAVTLTCGLNGARE